MDVDEPYLHSSFFRSSRQHFIMEMWYQPDEIMATAGDLVAFQRRWLNLLPYIHFAVCTVDSEAARQAIVQRNGNRITVGVDSPCIDIWRQCLSTRIVEKTIRNLCNKHQGCRVNNFDEAASQKGLRPFEPDEIVERAREFLKANRVIDYDLLEQNCEHFATKCRYGQAFSLQVSDFRTATVKYVLTWISAIRHACYSRRRPEVYVLGRTIDEVRQNEDISDVASS